MWYKWVQINLYPYNISLHVPLCPHMYPYVPTCTSMYPYVPLCPHVRLCPHMYPYLPTCTPMSPHVPLCPMYPYVPTCTPMSPCTPIFPHVPLCTPMYPYLPTCTPMSPHVSLVAHIYLCMIGYKPLTRLLPLHTVDMATRLITLSGGGPWGFTMTGGRDFGSPLKVAKVTT